MKPILLLGASGQVGHELARVLPPLGPLVCATRDGARGETADLADAVGLAALLERVQPRLIVNAAAWTAVDAAESEPDAALRVNGAAVGEIGRWAAAHGARVVHYSTDYVFDGAATRPWREDDPVAPLGSYGRSKRAGEEALAASGCHHLILRTAWVYAARGRNFLRTMLRLAATRDALRVVADQRGAPTPAPLIAAGTAAVLARWLAPGDAAAGAGGIFHLTSAGHCSWHEFAAAIISRAHVRGLVPRRVPVAPIPGSEYPTPARRPAWSVLDTSRLAATFGVALPAWEAGLELVLNDLAACAAATAE